MPRTFQNLEPGSALDAIGGTPVVELSRMFRDVEGRVIAKLDMLNPSGSSKDRVARQVLEDATLEGRLAPRQTVVELALAGTGIAYAMTCALTRHPFVAIAERGARLDRLETLRALGADVVLVDPEPGSSPETVDAGMLERLNEVAERVARERGAFYADGFQNVSNFRAHRLSTASEILIQTNGQFRLFCDFVGTGGTFAGCTAAFKEHNPAIHCFVVEPARGPGTSGHGILGGGYGRALPLLDIARVDGRLAVTQDEALAATRELARREGIFAGLSSGANLAAARKLLRGPRHGETVVVNLPDSGWKYFETDLWRDPRVDAA